VHLWDLKGSCYVPRENIVTCSWNDYHTLNIISAKSYVWYLLSELHSGSRRLNSLNFRAACNHKKSLWSSPSSKLIPTVEHQWRHNHAQKLLLRSCLQLWWIVIAQAIISGERIRSACVGKLWGWRHPMRLCSRWPFLTFMCGVYVFYEFSCYLINHPLSVVDNCSPPRTREAVISCPIVISGSNVNLSEPWVAVQTTHFSCSCSNHALLIYFT
jgi:hypothetical protein